MTDYTRQEVEDMALAAGYEFTWYPDDMPMIVRGTTRIKWNPWPGRYGCLDWNKAQCFDLAVAAELDFITADNQAVVRVLEDRASGAARHIQIEEFHKHASREAAFMHAICRAAIEKGRAMREGE